ncbi:MAG: hypothetical protein A3G39_08745 [Deltaproteobacteria bacterium RIFCSPLOWO2_12_FULL_43_16]|nr:MAG: hypothetical protein A3D30_00690 [Deltaproteobacteria bacterium RIFCSPHIGHO2_02_FULL_43_33]OGQ60263.1 MAG: hypothetical protein A3G39_08745 [Deltaproteobacteria bacterium RIFCSPLOWO2_12_FULL_43_16]HBR16060.1 hypothetical protein [Deltaproteobacteria bacterium]
MSEEFVITGIGVVSPAGIGKEAFWDSLINCKAGIKDIRCFDTKNKKSRLGGEIRDFDLDAVLPDKRFRRAANVSKYCLASAKFAIDDAGLDSTKWDGTKVGLVVGVTHSAINYSREFHAALVKEGPLSASPMIFSDSVLNAPAGNTSIAFNVKGATHTIVGGVPAGLHAISYAIKIMKMSNLDMCLVGGAEELDSLVFDTYSRFGLLSPGDRFQIYPQGEQGEGMKPFAIDRNGFVIGEGACVLMLEKKKAAIERKATIYAAISSIHTAMSLTTENCSGICNDIPDAAGIYLSTGANGTANDSTEAKILKKEIAKNGKPYIGNIKPIVGECFAASGIMQAASAAIVLCKGVIPPSTIRHNLIPEIQWVRFNRFEEKVKIKTAIVSSIGLEGEGSFLTLKRQT